MPSTITSTAATPGHPRTPAALEPREGACDMNSRQGTRPLAGAHRLIGLVLAFAPLPAAAQIGPRFTLRRTLRATVTLTGTYSPLPSSSKSPLYVNIDNHRYAGDLTLSHTCSSSSSAYLTGSSEKVEFTDQVDNNNFRQDQAL